ncbi:MAG: amidophosphoribosyltransferase, partial [Muribaculum sp.]|nr:amidophosphoribosyltransferase [Muribaculum sp.]
MEQLKHECGIAMIRLLKPLEYYKEKYGTYAYGLNKLYLLMEKQHNRGQEAAGCGCIKMHAPAGHEYVFRERALGANAIQEIFSSVNHLIDNEHISGRDADWVDAYAPFIGQIYMGHLRYSTTGRSGINYVHPFLRRNNWCSRSLMLCGNFNMTNVEQIFKSVVDKGQHPRIFSDTVIILEQLGYNLDKENNRLYHRFTEQGLDGIPRAMAIEDNIDLRPILRESAP